MATTLISWLGRTDLRAVTETEQVGLGPVAQALHTGRFARLELLCDYAPDDSYGATRKQAVTTGQSGAGWANRCPRGAD